MRTTRLALTKTKVNGRRYYLVTTPKLGGGRNRRFFKEKTEAETFMQLAKIQQENYGTAGMSFNERQRAEYLECVEKLQPFGVNLRDAVNFYLPHLAAGKRTCTAKELFCELLEVRQADGASERYLSDLRSRLGQFSDSFDGNPVAGITAPQVDAWLRSLSSKNGRRLSSVTRNHFRRLLIVAFNFAKGRGYCVDNPAEQSAKAKEIESTVGILTVEETAHLLESAAAELVPYIAIGAFAGLRRAELERLDWREVDLQSGLIEVTAAKAKSARRRFVKIQPNLGRWLQPHAQLGGSVVPSDYRVLLDAARKGAGIQQWPQNALRHSFASYHLAHFKDQNALALELGHTKSDLVFKHYRQLVKPKQAEQYWRLAPIAGGRQIVAFAP
jgi:integrase